MAYKISDECISCGACADACPVSCISEGDGKYVLVIEGAPEGAAEAKDFSSISPEEHVAKYESEGMVRMDDIKNSKGQRNEQIGIL
jgi:formate hydrogenlyase subunit 6/NADH:ubiquinone oxidoreductase subunit I